MKQPKLLPLDDPFFDVQNKKVVGRLSCRYFSVACLSSCELLWLEGSKLLLESLTKQSIDGATIPTPGATYWLFLSWNWWWLIIVYRSVSIFLPSDWRKKSRVRGSGKADGSKNSIIALPGRWSEVVREGCIAPNACKGGLEVAYKGVFEDVCKGGGLSTPLPLTSSLVRLY